MNIVLLVMAVIVVLPHFVSLERASPATASIIWLAALVLRAADFEVLGEVVGRARKRLALLGRTGPGVGLARGMQRVGIAALAEQHQRGERQLAVAGDIAAHLRHVAALADHFDAERQVLSHWRDEAHLRGAKRRQVGHRLADRLER